MLTLPNLLSLFRIALIPFLVYFLTDTGPFFSALAALTFFLASLTDFLDGYLARLYGHMTTLGKFLDPLADKLLLTTAYLCLALIKTLPEPYKLAAWVPVVVVSRDIIILLGSLVIYLMNGMFEIIPSRLGKATTLAQMATIVLALVGHSSLNIILPATMILTIASGIGYIRRGNRLLNGHTA